MKWLRICLVPFEAMGAGRRGMTPFVIPRTDAGPKTSLFQFIQPAAFMPVGYAPTGGSPGSH